MEVSLREFSLSVDLLVHLLRAHELLQVIATKNERRASLDDRRRDRRSSVLNDLDDDESLSYDTRLTILSGGESYVYDRSTVYRSGVSAVDIVYAGADHTFSLVKNDELLLVGIVVTTLKDDSLALLIEEVKLNVAKTIDLSKLFKILTKASHYGVLKVHRLAVLQLDDGLIGKSLCSVLSSAKGLREGGIVSLLVLESEGNIAAIKSLISSYLHPVRSDGLTTLKSNKEIELIDVTGLSAKLTCIDTSLDSQDTLLKTNNLSSRLDRISKRAGSSHLRIVVEEVNRLDLIQGSVHRADEVLYRHRRSDGTALSAQRREVYYGKCACYIANNIGDDSQLGDSDATQLQSALIALNVIEGHYAILIDSSDRALGQPLHLGLDTLFAIGGVNLVPVAILIGLVVDTGITLVALVALGALRTGNTGLTLVALIALDTLCRILGLFAIDVPETIVTNLDDGAVLSIFTIGNGILLTIGHLDDNTIVTSYDVLNCLAVLQPTLDLVKRGRQLIDTVVDTVDITLEVLGAGGENPQSEDSSS